MMYWKCHISTPGTQCNYLGKTEWFPNYRLPVGLGQCGLMVFSKRLPVVFKNWQIIELFVAACEPEGVGHQQPWKEGDVTGNGNRLSFACRTSLLSYDSYGKTTYCHQEAAMREEYEICSSSSRKHPVFSNDQFIIFTLSSTTEGCTRDLLFSALNNSSQTATCEITELTRIYSSRWSFCFLLGLRVMTTRAWCKMYMLISLSFFIFMLFYDSDQL